MIAASMSVGINFVMTVVLAKSALVRSTLGHDS